MIIDTHAHVVPKSLLDALRSEKRPFPSVRLDTEGAAPRIAFAGGAPGRPIQPRLHDLAQRRAWLKEARVDHQLVGGWTDVYGYELTPEEGADWARFYNEHMAKDAGALPAHPSPCARCRNGPSRPLPPASIRSRRHRSSRRPAGDRPAP